MIKPVRIILDFEASSLRDGYPIEVGIAKTWQDGSITSAARLIRNDPWLQHGCWTETAQQCHGITKQKLSENGQNPRVVAEWLNEMIGSQTAYSDCEKDQGWLQILFNDAGIKPSFALHHIEEIFDAAVEIDEDSITTLMSAPTHRAEADAVQISRMVQQCLKLAG